MITGLGSDIVNVTRIESLLTRFGDKFLHKIFSPREIAIFTKRHHNHKASFLAKRFAAKEAYLKAINKNNPNITFNKIEILSGEKGEPQIFVDGVFLKNALISLSDDYPYAFAVVIIQD